MIEQKTVYLIRHCQADGQAPDARLTPEGQQQAARLAELCGSWPIERVLSSPFRRAVSSVAPLARRLKLPIITDERLVERVLSTAGLADWRAALRATFDDLELCFEGGESSRAAMQRAVAAFNDAMAHPARVTVMVTHGNLMTLLLRYFDPAIGFATWQHLANPDVYQVKIEGQAAQVAHMALE